MTKLPGKRKLEDLVDKGYTQGQIAEMYDSTQGAVSRRMAKFGVVPKHPEKAKHTDNSGRCTSCHVVGGHRAGCKYFLSR